MNILKRFSLLGISFAVFWPSASFANKVNDYLAEKQKEFPECVRVVRNQLVVLPEESQIAMLPYLFDACKSGRAIGEKRTRKLFQKKKTDPQK
jgi:hypothetical protein